MMQVRRIGDGMGQTRGRRRLTAMVGGASALVASVWLVSALATGGSGVSPAGSPAVFVVIPLVMLLLIAGLAWFLLARNARPDSDPEPSVECPSCGRSILQEWRLCPFCGSRISQASVPDPTLTSRRDLTSP